MQNSEFHKEIKKKVKDYKSSLSKEELNPDVEKFLNRLITGLKDFDKNYNIVVQEASGRFLDTEFDFNETGIKGVGRMGTEIPRFAGYIQDYMDEVEAREFQKDIEMLLKKGFLTLIVFRIDKVDYDVEKVTSEKLYDEFIPLIYVSWDWFFESGVFQAVFEIIVNDDIEILAEKIKGESSLDIKILKLILIYYFIAGLCLVDACNRLQLET